MAAYRLSSLPLLLAALLFALAAPAAPPQAAAGAVDRARMEQMVQSFGDRFMGAVLVAQDGEVLFSKGYGSANLEWKIANAPSTRFRLGSVTKQFTAAAILLLEERGKLKLTDPVKTHLADAPAAWDGITIFHLLTHTAGLKNFTALPEYRTWQLTQSTPAQTVARFRDLPLDFAPGEQHRYSNSGYLLLGYLIEKISGKSYAEFVRENIFTPLAMADSGFDSNEAIIERRAAGYSPGPAGPRNTGFIHMSIPHAAGSLYSTTEDLLKWNRGLYGGKLLQPASLAKMLTPFKDNYALGVLVRTPAGGRKQVSHGGGIEGFNTHLIYYPESKITVAVLANLNGPVADLLASQLGQAAHGDPVKLTSERTETKLARELLATYVGTYQLEAAPLKMMVTLEGEQLMTQLSGQPKFPLFAESEGKFFLKVVDAQLDFVKNGDGRVSGAVLHQGGRDMPAKRISDTVEERKAVAVSAEVLKAHAGTYQGGPLTVHITHEGDRLMTQIPGQPKFELFAESDTRFFLKVVDAQIEFTRDAAGHTTELTLKQGPANIKASRVKQP